MQTGKLDQLITFQQLIETNVSGELQQSWAVDSPPDQAWAEVITERGSSALESARINAREVIRVRVRYRDDIDDTWRLQWADQDYYIKHIDRSHRRKGALWITAEVVGAA